MAMNFYRLLLEVQSEDIFRLADGIFGDCSRRDYGTGGVVCIFKGREFQFIYFSQSNAVYIAFYFVRGEKPATVSSKDLTSYGSGQELQPGTMEGIDRFRKFIGGLKDLGVGVMYTSGGRRKDLYMKVMQQVGMKKDSEGVWR